MKKQHREAISEAKTKSWRKGGPSRVAYEQRLKRKNTKRK